MNSNHKATVPKVNDSSRGTAFYYLATCLLLLLILDKPLIFKYIDKYYKNKEEI